MMKKKINKIKKMMRNTKQRRETKMISLEIMIIQCNLSFM